MINKRGEFDFNSVVYIAIGIAVISAIVWVGWGNPFSSFQDLLVFENPGIVALAIGLLAFIVAFTVLSRMMDKGPSVTISLILGILAGFYLYRNDFFGWESKTLAFVLLFVAIAIVLKIAWAFIKSGKRQFGR